MVDRVLWTCVESRLDLHVSLHELPSAPRLALLRWLHVHGVDSLALIAGRPVMREPETGTLIWFANTADGVMLRRISRPTSGQKVWPAPFPPVLLGSGAAGAAGAAGVASAPA